MDPNVIAAPVMCEVCGTIFETRRGLSSHARLHLRQLGVTLSESSGAPIDLLYQIIQERDGSFPNPKKTSSALPVLTPSKTTTPPQEPRTLPGPKEKGSSSSKALRKAMATLHKTASQGSPATSFLAPSSSTSTSSSSGPSQAASAKPLWAPQETDAPLTLATNSKDEVHVCQLCGAWYETRKGLASHARAHLRQFGVTENTETKGGPIELLYQIMQAEDVSPIGGKQQQEPSNPYAIPKSPVKRPSALSSPPASGGSPSPSESLQSPPPKKRVKTSEEFTCLLCGEEFENRKGLASHSRSHLRQIGVTDLLGKASAIDAVQQLVSTGVLAGVPPLKAKQTNTPAPSPAPSPSPSGRSTQSPLLTAANRAPKAKKGFQLAVDPLSRKPKPEHIEVEVSSQPPQAGSWSRPTASAESGNAGSSTDTMETIPHIPCEFCSQLFDSRKALSCHARAHLRQLGITWPVNESPIDVLKDYMDQSQKVKDEGAPSAISAVQSKYMARNVWAPHGPKRSMDGLSSGGPSSKPNTSPLNFSMKDKMAGKNGTSSAGTACELCGFEFDNRKALASHARAHLRQLGVGEWKVEGAKGSPIKLLSEWIQREPAKVVEITRRYRMGDLYIKKTQRSDPSPSPSPSVPGGTVKSSVSTMKVMWLPPGHRVDKDTSGVSSASSKGVQGRLQTERAYAQPQPPRGDLRVHSARGFHAPERPAPMEEENQDTNSQQPPRSGNIPALLPKPPLAPLVKMVGKVYSLKCRFCEEVFHGPLSIQEDWVRHLQKHILKLGYRGKASPPPTPVTAPTLVGPVAM